MGYEKGGNMEENKCNCSNKLTKREEGQYKDLVRRINRIEGQVRGIKKMIDEERYCVDILKQVSAVQADLNSFNRILLIDHIKNCILTELHDGKDEVIEELCATIQKIMK